MKKIIALLTALTLVLSVTACANGSSDGLVDGKVVAGYLEVNKAEENSYLNWAKSAVDEGVKFSKPDNYEVKSYSSVVQMLLDLGAGRLSYFSGLPLCTAQYICAAKPDYSYVEGASDLFFKMAVLDDKEKLRDDLNTALSALKSEGTLDTLKSEYVDNVTAPPAVNALTKIDGADTVKVGVTGDFTPFDYISADGTPAGYNVALLNALSEKMGVNFELVSIEASARTTALSAGTIDIVFWMLAYADQETTAYPDGKLLFTDSYLSEKGSVLTKNYPIDSIKQILNME